MDWIVEIFFDKSSYIHNTTLNNMNIIYLLYYIKEIFQLNKVFCKY